MRLYDHYAGIEKHRIVTRISWIIFSKHSLIWLFSEYSKSSVFFCMSWFFFFWWGLNSELWTCKAALLLELHLQSKLYHLSYASIPFLLQVIFHIGSCTFCLGLASDNNPPTYAFWVAGTIGAYHHAHIICWDVVSPTFCQELQSSWTPPPE
jgi:hypothetical protein